MKLEYSDQGEPFIQLDSPLDSYILTPYRDNDKTRLIETLNHPNVFPNLSTPPYPYTKADADWWLDNCKKDKEYILNGKRLTSLWIIRNPEGLFVGQVGLDEYPHTASSGPWHPFNPPEPKPVTRSVSPVDTYVTYEIGDFMHQDSTGKGIMTAAIRAVLDVYVGQVLGGARIRTSVFTPSNPASKRVFEKLGFNCLGIAKGAIPIQESKGGGAMDVWIAELIVHGQSK